MFEEGIHLSPEAYRDLPPTVQRVDVREPWEAQLACLPGTLLIPLSEFTARFQELDPNRPVALHCHHGMRSMSALRFLKAQGFADVAHLRGGIDAYSLMDASVPRY